MSALELTSRLVGEWLVGVIEAGRGVPVVFLHGSADGAFAWKSVLERMATDHRVCAIDFGSTVRLDGSDEGERLEADRGLLHGVLASLGEPAHLVGHSYGALLALRYALEHAGAVRSLCLTEPIAFGLLRDESGRHRSEGLVGPVLERFFHVWDSAGPAEAVGFILDYWNGPGSWAATAAPQRERILAGANRLHQEVSCAYADRTSLAETAALRLPALIACGAQTTEAARLVCGLLSGSIPGARSLRVAGAGHSPMRTHPDRFLEALSQLTASRGV